MSAALEASNLGFCRDGSQILCGVSFRIEPGESVALVGPNGAGKSTLLWRLMGLLKGAGEVRLRAARIAMVFQNPEDQLFMPSLLDDLALPLRNGGMAREQAEEQAREALAAVDLEPHAEQAAHQLSLGQRKRAAIALALVRRPELLLLDEPTSELDGRSVRNLVATLNSLAVTKLIASHHLEFLRQVASRGLVLVEGRLVAEGPLPHLLADRDRLTGWGLL